MDELLLVDDIGALIEKAEDNMYTLDSLIESCDAQIQSYSIKNKSLSPKVLLKLLSNAGMLMKLLKMNISIMVLLKLL